MDSSLTYRVRRDPDGLGWVVGVDGRVTQSLPYNNREEALEQVDLLVKKHPGAQVIVDETTPAPSINGIAPPER